MNMFNDEMGDYVMENRVVEFEPERRIVWEPVMRFDREARVPVRRR
jgi:hypothetical protein